MTESPLSIHEIGNTYVSAHNRFVVSLVVGYSGTVEEDDVDSPEMAAYAALDLTRDTASGDTHWYVFDRQTGIMHLLEQSSFEYDGGRRDDDETGGN